MQDSVARLGWVGRARCDGACEMLARDASNFPPCALHALYRSLWDECPVNMGVA